MGSEEGGGVGEKRREESGFFSQSRGLPAQVLHPLYRWPFSSGGILGTVWAPEVSGMEEASQLEQETVTEQMSS